MGKTQNRRKVAAARSEPAHTNAEWKAKQLKKADDDLWALHEHHLSEIADLEQRKAKEIDDLHEYYANLITEKERTRAELKVREDGLHSKISEQSTSIRSIKNWCEIVLRNQIEQAAFTSFQLDAGRLIGAFSEAETERISENFGMDDCKINYNKLVDRCQID